MFNSAPPPPGPSPTPRYFSVSGRGRAGHAADGAGPPAGAEDGEVRGGDGGADPLLLGPEQGIAAAKEGPILQGVHPASSSFSALNPPIDEFLSSLLEDG